MSGSGDDTVQVWNPAAASAAIEEEPEGHSKNVNALVTFVDPATGEPRVACGSADGKVHIYDPVAGGAALVVLEGHTAEVKALTAFQDPATGERPAI